MEHLNLNKKISFKKIICGWWLGAKQAPVKTLSAIYQPFCSGPYVLEVTTSEMAYEILQPLRQASAWVWAQPMRDGFTM